MKKFRKSKFFQIKSFLKSLSLLFSQQEAHRPMIDSNNVSYISQKIPRTRDGSVDFGKSKEIEYGFARNPQQIGERALRQDMLMQNPGNMYHEKVKRHYSEPGPDSLPSKISKIADTASQKFISPEVFKKLTQEREIEMNSMSSKPENRFPDQNTEKQCKICNRPAQYLCSGCRKAWYCSQECQVCFYSHLFCFGDSLITVTSKMYYIEFYE